MDPIATTAFAFAAGLTVSGMGATLAQIISGEPVGFVEPYLARRRILRSLALTALAGPFMLGNDALRAFASGRIGRVRLGTFALVAATWALALGVLVIALAAEAGSLLT